MKKVRKSMMVFAIMAICGATVMSGACSQKEEKTEQTIRKVQKKPAAGELPNYRYVDSDSLLSMYNLAKDYNEEMVRMQQNLDNAAKRHDSSIKSFAQQVQNKVQNNVYQSQASYQADEHKLQQMQASAQKELQGLQENMEKSAMQAQKAVADSIQAYIKEYNKKHGYDAIFMKAATLYIDERLDITKEVGEGLNARYNKVKK